MLSPVEGAEIIAQSPQAANQAMRIGPNIRTLQWHPEMTAEVIEIYIKARAEVIESEFDSAHVRALLTQLQPAESGQRILQNFLKFFVKPAH